MVEEGQCLIVLGMHRSGTSFMGRWMVESGFDFGSNLVPGGIGNQDGHFEDMDFHDLHERIFSKYEIPYGGFEDLEKLKLDDDDVGDIECLVEQKARQNRYWGWKEPRTCLFLSEYEKILPSAKVIVIYRDVDKVVSSLIKRDREVYFRKRGKKMWPKRLYYRVIYKLITKFSDLNGKYRRTWLMYNQSILEYLSNKEKTDYVVVDFHKIKNKEVVIREFVESHFSGVKLVPLSNVFNSDRITAITEDNGDNGSDCQVLSEKLKNLMV